MKRMRPTVMVLVGLLASVLAPVAARSAPPDTTPPDVTAFDLDMTAVDVTDADATIVVSATVTDSESGVECCPQAIFIGPTGQFAGVLFEDPPVADVWTAQLTIPEDSEPGLWKIDFFIAYDAEFNVAEIDHATGSGLGFDVEITVTSTAPDLTPPTLVSFDLEPESVDVSGGDQTITGTIEVTDAQTGVITDAHPSSAVGACCSVIQAISPSSFGYAGTFTGPPDPGNTNSGTWETSFDLPQGSEPGCYLIYVMVRDRVTNTDELSQGALEAVSPGESILAVNTTCLAPGGGTVTADPGGSVSFGHPFSGDAAVTVTTPSGGDVTITPGPVTAVSGYTIGTSTISISAPAESAADPLVIDFLVPASSLPPGSLPGDVVVFRDGGTGPAPVADCTGAPQAIPDPCVASRDFAASGDFAITVLTSEASDWAFGTPETKQPVGLVNPGSGRWYLQQGVDAAEFFYGNPGDVPFVGDWDCDGTDTPGLYRQSDGYVYLRNSNSAGFADITFFFGNTGDIPIAGDFDNDGCDTVSLYRPSNQRFYIINELGEDGGALGAADYWTAFGNPGDLPFVGDFDGDGFDEIGLHRATTGLVYYEDALTVNGGGGAADHEFLFGDPGDRFIAGDWDMDGADSPAVFRPSDATFYFRYTNTAGVADEVDAWGMATWLPISGIWFNVV